MNFNLSSLLFILSYVALSHGCTSDSDCSLNGVCSSSTSTCECDSGWTAADCSALDLSPATLGTGYNLTSQNTSSWGSKIIQDPSDPNLFHLFAAEFTNHCGLDYWSPYSRIIRAVSTAGPAGPYAFEAEVVGPFAHNPTVIWSPADAKYLLYYIGCPQHPNLTTCSPPLFSCGPGNYLNGESGISVASSPNLIDWTFEGQVFKGEDNSDWDADVTNPSPFPLYTGSNTTGAIALAFRGCIVNCTTTELIDVATAPSFLGPYTKVQPNAVFPEPNEDPFIWRDKRGNWHMLLHSLEPKGGFGDGPNVGRHAFAEDLNGPWTFVNANLAYSTVVEFEDGSEIDYFRRERPQLFFGVDMTPLFLTTGVQQRNSTMSYSLIQPVRQSCPWGSTKSY